VVRLVNERSVVTEDGSTSPLRLLCPDHIGKAAWIYTTTFGGGAVAGDHIDLDVLVGESATAVLTTQSAAKVFHRQGAAGCSQTLRARVEGDGLLILAPDPVSCFADAVYEQRQHIELSPDASLVLVDWMTCGRAAMGERWAFAKYDSRNDVWVADKTLVRDAVRLDASEQSLDSALASGPMDCLASVVLIGPAVYSQAKAWHDAIVAAPLEKQADVWASASPVEGGFVIRLVGRATQHVGKVLRDAMAWLEPTVGRGLWDHKR